jgi:hypothetical protein
MPGDRQNSTCRILNQEYMSMEAGSIMAAQAVVPATPQQSIPTPAQPATLEIRATVKEAVTTMKEAVATMIES